jgi:hypothetical protein
MTNITPGQVLTTFTGNITQSSNVISLPSPMPTAYQYYPIAVSSGTGSISSNTIINNFLQIPSAISSSYAVNLSSNTMSVTFPTTTIGSNGVITVSSGFCIEFWVMFPSTMPTNTIIFGSNAPNRFAITLNGSNQISIQNSQWFALNPNPVVLQTKTWYHVAVFGSGTTNCIAVNGIVFNTNDAGGNNTSTHNGLWTIVGNFGNANDGWTTNSAQLMYVSNFRIVVGSNVYTTGIFTPPSAPLTAITNTKFLTFNSATIVDNNTQATPIVITTANNPTMVSPSTDINLLPQTIMNNNATASGTATFSILAPGIQRKDKDYIQEAQSTITNKKLGWS